MRASQTRTAVSTLVYAFPPLFLIPPTALPQGRRWKLRDYVKAHMTTLQHDYRKLNSSEKNILRQGLDKTQEKRVKLVRSNPKAMAKYVDKTFDDMDRDVSIFGFNRMSCSHVTRSGLGSRIAQACR